VGGLAGVEAVVVVTVVWLKEHYSDGLVLLDEIIDSDGPNLISILLLKMHQPHMNPILIKVNPNYPLNPLFMLQFTGSHNHGPFITKYPISQNPPNNIFITNPKLNQLTTSQKFYYRTK
jgi:hypothetical protein